VNYTPVFWYLQVYLKYNIPSRVQTLDYLFNKSEILSLTKPIMRSTQDISPAAT
jgi:hypothetical protein